VFLLKGHFGHFVYSTGVIVIKKTWLVLLFGLLISHAQVFLFEGNQFFSTQNLQAQIGLGSDWEYVPLQRRAYLLDISLENFKDLYSAFGYFDIQIQYRQIQVDGLQRIVFSIQEGVRYRFNEVNFNLSDWTAPEPNMNQLKAKEGVNYEAETLISDVETLRKFYRNKGYLHVQFETITTLDTLVKQVHVNYQIYPDRLVLMDRMHVQSTKVNSYKGPAGGKGFSDSLYISELWGVSQGEVVSGDAIQNFRTKLLATGAFSRVEIRDTLIDTLSGYSEILVDLRERIPGTLSGAFFYEDQIGFGIQTKLGYRNFFGRFHQMNSELILAQRRQQIGLAYVQPLLFSQNMRFENRVIYNREELPIPERRDSLELKNELINRSQLSRPLANYFRIYFITDLRYVHPSKERVRFKWEPGISFDYTDNRYEPRRGLRMNYSFGQGGPLDFENRYWYYQLKNRIYLPIIKSTRFAGAADYGKYLSEAITEDARLFYQGGFRSVRGYFPRSIFPKIMDSDTLVGAGKTPEYWRLSAELHNNWSSRFISNLNTVVFTDWARIQDLNSEFETNQRMAAGLGLRYQLSLLTIRLDYTFKKKFHSYSLEPFSWSRFSFDLSQAF
jgi:outer membrane protein assembly factor BamA